MKSLSKAQNAALEWLTDRGGSGVIDNYGRVLAAGERSSFEAVTWLRLVTLGYVVEDGPFRLRVRRAA